MSLGSPALYDKTVCWPFFIKQKGLWEQCALDETTSVIGPDLD